MAGYGSPKSGKINYLVVGLGVFVVALVIYFLFFTRTPDEATLTNVPLQPSTRSETTKPAPDASAAPGDNPTPARAN